MHPALAAALVLIVGAPAGAASPLPPTIVLLGPPGAGKSTQAAKLASAHGYVIIASGDLLRAEVARKTPLGATIAAQMARGELVTDDIVDALVERRLAREDCRRGLVFDGYPRTVTQARALDGMLAAHGLAPPLVLHLEAPDGVLVGRLLERGRADDRLGVIARRLALYRAEAAPVATYYRGERYHVIRADGTVDQAFAAIEAVLSSVSR